jgi:hypothetical protein
MKTFGLLETQELVSLLPLDDESYSTSQLKPSAAVDEWAQPTAVPLVKLPQPAFDAATHKCDSLLVWFKDRVERDWEITPLTAREIRAKVPQSITVRQLREWLIRNDLFESVELILASVPNATERAIAENWWNYATEYQRAHPLVSTLGEALGMSAEQIDTAWVAASKL